MTQSNTKLSKIQKEILAEYKADYPNIKLVTDGVTTFAYEFKGNTVRFATSVMSPNEKKFRRKVGEYQAMLNLVENDRFVHVRSDEFVYMLEYFDIYIDGEFDNKPKDFKGYLD